MDYAMDMDYVLEPRQFTPEDPDVEQRMAMLRELGLEPRPYREFDEFAAELAKEAGAPHGYAMVNFIGPVDYYFAGLYTPPSQTSAEAAQQAGVTAGQPSRVMARDHGFCSLVVVRRKALVLEDVCEYPRFAGNPVVDELGIRSYLGAPMLDRNGAALGTVCVVTTEPHPWGHHGLRTVKRAAQRVVDYIERQQHRRLR